MKKIFCLILLTTVNLVSFAQNSMVEKKSSSNFEKMSFEVSLDNDNYMPLEPMFAKFSFANKTSDELITEIPNFLQETKIRVGFDRKIRDINYLGSVIGNGIRFPSTFKPNEIYEKEEMLGPSVGWHFTEKGTYQLQFILRSADGSHTLESNLIEIEIREPQGKDKEAFNFLNKHRDFFGLSSWFPEKKECENLLETFVNKYSQSVYGELAISSLGDTYFSKGEFDKAKAEFEKISSSDNKYIADNAKRSLTEIEAKKKALEQTRQKQN